MWFQGPLAVCDHRLLVYQESGIVLGVAGAPGGPSLSFKLKSGWVVDRQGSKFRKELEVI